MNSGPVKFFLKSKDGSFLDHNNNMVFMSLERFQKDVCQDGHCFMCGAAPESKEFNKEHIIPKWILRRFDLFDKTITLPNGHEHRYRHYVVPCCTDCNSLLDEVIEREMSELFLKDYASICEHIKEQGPEKLFLWLCLIFIKTHIKDTYVFKEKDKRLGDSKIGDNYDWGVVHHIHCMARALITNVIIEPECIGTLLLWPAKQAEHIRDFDFKDNFDPNTILLRIGGVVIIAILDDWV